MLGYLQCFVDQRFSPFNAVGCDVKISLLQQQLGHHLLQIGHGMPRLGKAGFEVGCCLTQERGNFAMRTG